MLINFDWNWEIIIITIIIILTYSHTYINSANGVNWFLQSVVQAIKWEFTKITSPKLTLSQSCWL